MTTKINYVDVSKRISVGKRSSDRAQLIHVGSKENTPVFAVLDPEDSVKDIPSEPDAVTILQLLKFSYPDDWELDEEKIRSLMQ